MFVVVIMSFMIANFAFAEPVPAEHKSHCRVWKDGHCEDGALTDLAVSLTSNPRCEAYCGEACPSCRHCGLCAFCKIYNSDKCKGVPYYANGDTCEKLYTKNCCDMCEAQCYTAGGACDEEGMCYEGTAETSPYISCVIKEDGMPCEPCHGET